MRPSSPHYSTTPFLLVSAFVLSACSDTPTQPSPSGSLKPAARVATEGAFRAIDLGTLGGTYSAALRINPAGQVVGYSTTASGQYHAFVWHRGVMTDLGTLGGGFSVPDAINAAGQVVGYSTTASGRYHPFLWGHGVMTDLGVLSDFPVTPGTFMISEARDINPAGRVVGCSETVEGWRHAVVWDQGTMTDLGTPGVNSCAAAVGPRGEVVVSEDGPAAHAFVWDRGVMTDLGTPPGGLQTWAVAINPAGQVAGGYTTAGEQHAFLWDRGTMTDLGTLGGNETSVAAISPTGQVVGTSETTLDLAGWRHAFLWTRGTMTDLGTLSGEISISEGWDVNPAGQVVGNSLTVRDEWRAFIWEHGTMIELGTLGGTWSSAIAINPAGQIVGSSQTATGESHATLWTR